ncbi:pyridoxamine 5'-phosphate oxidase family protein [Streptomyces lydicus]
MSDLVNEPGPAVRLRLAEEQNVWLCTVRSDGSAHVTPVWFVYQNSRWWIGSDHSSVKVRNIGKEPRVSLALEDGRFPVVLQRRRITDS